MPFCPIAFAAAVTIFIGPLALCSVGDERFVAHSGQGKRLQAPRLAAWPLPGSSGRLEGKDLFAAEDPVRLLRDRDAEVKWGPPLLVLANGDVINGTPLALVSEAGSQQVPRVKVQLESPLMPVSGTHVLVRTDRVRRIVGQHPGVQRAEPPAGTVLLTDGRRLLARSIRWREYGLAILTEAGVVEANYADLADIVFPAVDLTTAVLEDNLFATAGVPAAIARFTLTSGAILTASRASREVERTRTRRGSSQPQVYYYLQPAWSSHALAVPEQAIAWCSYRSAEEAPLSLLPAETLANRRLIGKAEPWRRNETSAGSPLLASGELEADQGIAAHSHSEIGFTLPAGAKTLSLSLGLDRTVGEGGCVHCRIAAETAGGPALWESGSLRGSDGVKEVEGLDVTGIRRLVFVTEYAHDNRPDGSDPLDIRDDVLWLAPMVTLDWSPQTGGELMRSALAGLGDWEPQGHGWEDARLATQWNEADDCWDPVLLVTKNAELTLTRKLKVTSASDVLQLLAACPRNLEEHLIHLTVNDESVGWTTSTDREKLRQLFARYRSPFRGRDPRREQIEPSDTLAYWWDLQKWRGQEVTVELSIRGNAERNQIAWRGLSHRSALANLPPGGEPLEPEISLTSLTPRTSYPSKERGGPAKDSLPLVRTKSPIRFLGQEYDGGYGMVRSSQVTFDLRPEYRSFVALVGCCEGESGPVRVVIDGRVVWEKASLSCFSPAEQISVAIPANSNYLSLETGVDNSSVGIIGWAKAGFQK